MEAYQAPPLRMMIGMVARVSTLFRTVGFSQRPAIAGNGGRGRGSPRLPSTERMRAVSSPQTKAPAPIMISMSKLKPVPRMFFAEQAVFVGLVDGLADALDGKRVFGAAVDDAFVRADGAGADGHPFDDALRIAFQLGAVHEGARVAFVGVAHDVLLVAGGLFAELPFQAGGEAGAAAAADARLLDLIDDLIGGHLGERLGEGGPSVHGDVFVDAFGIDDAAVCAGDLVLMAEEVDFAEDRHLAFHRRTLVKVFLRDAALEQMLFRNACDGALFESVVENAAGIDHDDRTLVADTVATGQNDIDLVLEFMLPDFLKEQVVYFQGAGCNAPGSAADENR